METILVVVHLFLAIGLVGLILVQHGKGADMGAAFGSGSSATVFGSAGAGNFLSRTTGVLAALFFITSLALAYFAMQTGEAQSVMQTAEEAPAAIQQSATETEVPVIPSDIPVAPAVQGDVPVIPE